MAEDTTAGEGRTAPIEHALRWAGAVERAVLVALLVMLLVVVLVSTFELGVLLVSKLASPASLEQLLGSEALFAVYETFFLILIGVELMDTVRVYLKEEVIHVEAVLLVAITAVARKVIVLDLGKYGALVLLGLGALMLALTGGYYLLRLGMRTSRYGSAA